MPKLQCRCGYVHFLSRMPDHGFRVFPDVDTDRLLYAEGELDRERHSELVRLVVTRLYTCPNCEALMWESAGDGLYKTYVLEPRLPRVFVNFDDRDPLGGIFLRDPRSAADVERQRLLLGPGLLVTAHDDDNELYGEVWNAVTDRHGSFEVDKSEWVVRPVEPEVEAELRNTGA